MKSWWIEEAQGRMALNLREVPVPKPKAGEIAIRIHAAGLNRGEFVAGYGLHGASAARPAGFEASGVVTAVGEGVAAFEVGDAVMGRCVGAFSEAGVMMADQAYAKPSWIGWEQAATIPVVYTTIHDTLIAQGRLAKDEWLLIIGASSGVGVAALQVAKALGAKVIGTSGSSPKLGRLKDLGLDVAIETRSPDFVDAVLEATGGRGADLAVNPVGGSVFAACVEALGFEGRLGLVGYLDGVVRTDLDILALHRKRLQLFGVSTKLLTNAHRAAASRAFSRDILPLFEQGRIEPVVDEVFAFDALPAARLRMEEGSHLGKIAVRIA